MIALFNELAAQGTCLLVSSHVLDEVARLGSTCLSSPRATRVAGDYHTLRDQMDDRPHRVRIGTDQPKEIAAALIDLAEGVAVTATAVEANTTDVDSFGRAIAPLAVELGARLNEVAPLDDDLESVSATSWSVADERLPVRSARRCSPTVCFCDSSSPVAGSSRCLRSAGS